VIAVSESELRAIEGKLLSPVNREQEQELLYRQR